MTRAIGLVLVVLGCLGAAYAAVEDAASPDWPLYGAALAAAAIGVAILRASRRSERRSTAHVAAGMDALTDSAGKIAAGVAALVRPEGGVAIRTAELPERIDRTLRADLDRFAEARESLIVERGVKVYADIMSRFAAGERYVNRAWSSASDGYGAEASASLLKAEKQFAEVVRQIRGPGERPAEAPLVD